MAQPTRTPRPLRPEWLGLTAVLIPCKYTLCTSQAIFDAELKRLKQPGRPYLPSRAGACCHFYKHTDTGEIIVLVTIEGCRDDIRPGPVIAAMLAHEAVHIWQEMCDIIGETTPSSEFEAYTIQRITLELLSEYSRQVHGTGRSGEIIPPARKKTKAKKSTELKRKK